MEPRASHIPATTVLHTRSGFLIVRCMHIYYYFTLRHLIITRTVTISFDPGVTKTAESTETRASRSPAHQWTQCRPLHSCHYQAEMRAYKFLRSLGQGRGRLDMKKENQ